MTSNDLFGKEAMKRRQFLTIALGAGACALGLPVAVRGTPRGVETETVRAWRAMGTLMEVRIPDLPRADAVEAIRRVRGRMEELEAAMTLFRPESPLVAFNFSQAGAWFRVPKDLAEPVALSIESYLSSGGRFDPTVAPAMRAWGLHDLASSASNEDALRAWRGRPPATAIEVDLGNARLRRHDPRVELDLGGIGKGIAADAVLKVLHAAGSRGALINMGGSVAVLGPPPGRPEGWPVGIAHPREPGSVWSTLNLHHGHLATSGDYERTVQTTDGMKHHLLDPGSGEPTQGVASVTVWGETGVEADVSSTAHMVALARGESPAARNAVLTLMERDGALRVRKGPAPGVSGSGSSDLLDRG